MWLIIESLLVKLGSSGLRLVFVNAAKEIVSKFGMSATKTFFKQVTAEQLKGLSQKEIVALAEQFLKQGAKTGLDDAIFSKSNAKVLAGLFNRGIDKIDAASKNYMIRRLASSREKEFAEILGKYMNIPNVFEVLGTDHPQLGSFSSKVGITSGKIRDAYRWGLETALFPMTKTQSFTSGYFRGIAGHTTIGALESALSLLPRQILMSPKYRAVIRSFQSEITFFGASKQAGVKTADQLFNSIKIAAKAGKTIGIGETNAKSTVAGYISGRVTVPIFSTFVFVDKDERQKHIDKFQKSIPNFVTKRAKSYVDSYTRQDGTRVHGYYREFAA